MGCHSQHNVFQRMTHPPRIAFYAPLKPPDHSRPSGDRQMARMLMAALRRAGYDVHLASRYIAYSKRPEAAFLQARRAGALLEAQRLLRDWEASGLRPDLWFCYHPYDKAPDWLGVAVCEALGIAMVTAEPCRTHQEPAAAWVPWREEAQRGLSMAALHLVMNDDDEAYLRGFVPRERLLRFTPFLDVGELEQPDRAAPSTAWDASDACRLLAVGMQRPGAKLESYRVLAQALAALQGRRWQLAIAGGGPAHDDVRAAFAWDVEGRVRFLGEQSEAQVGALMRTCDLLAWPGCREAYGMVYLEAAAHGKPAAALRNRGVPLVVAHGVGGLLADPPDAVGYRDVLDALIGDAALRARLGAGARQLVLERHSATQAAARLREAIDPLLRHHTPQ
jgi:glycosyltransferase involved in cell wall biosynthesis